MVTKSKISTLLPYLDVQSSFYLKITLSPLEDGAEKKSGSPFLVVSDSDPYSRTYDARLFTDAGAEISHTCLILQKDEYNIQKDELRPICNKDIERHWQRAFLFYSRDNQANPLFATAGQMDADGNPVPFNSLFYCRHKKEYFHPPCPDCGQLLQLCHDDTILTECGLLPYTTSIERYLYCPACFESKKTSGFYTFSLKAGEPLFVKDRNNLIKDFGKLLKDKVKSKNFPCLSCEDKTACFSLEHMASSRIEPFSFYPFHALIIKSGSINALDFLPLISGAGVKDVERHLVENHLYGRLSCLKELTNKNRTITPFFSLGQNRFFLEVLYLKLSFLGELVEHVLSETYYSSPDLRFSMDKIWIDLPEQNSRLPFFWNFKTRIIETGVGMKSSRIFSKPNQAYSFYYIGIAWFYVLCANRTQGAGQINFALENMLDESAEKDEIGFIDLLNCGTHPEFNIENIFWKPEEYGVNPRWNAIWEKTLVIGWRIFKAELSGDKKWSADHFRQELNILISEIKENLFGKVNVEVRTDNQEEQNRAIRDILLNVRKKIQEDVTAETAEDSEETIALSKTDMVSDTDVKQADVSEQTLVIPSGGVEDDDDVLNETVILSPDRDAQDADETKNDLSPAEEKPLETDDDDFQEETVIISSDTPFEAEIVKQIIPEDDVFDETVIIRSTGQDSKDEKFSLDEKPKKAPEPLSEDDDLNETVIIRKNADAPVNNNATAFPEEQESIPVKTDDELLDETVIIRAGEKNVIKEQDKPSVQESPDQTVIMKNGKTIPVKEAEMDETVIMRPERKDMELKQASSDYEKTEENKSGSFTEDSDDDSDLDETVIIRPGKNGK